MSKLSDMSKIGIFLSYCTFRFFYRKSLVQQQNLSLEKLKTLVLLHIQEEVQKHVKSTLSEVSRKKPAEIYSY